MFSMKLSPAKTGLLAFLASFALGLAIFIGFGLLAGAFTSEAGVLDALAGSPLGYVALFGATLMLASPIIGITIWAYDRAIRMTIEQRKK